MWSLKRGLGSKIYIYIYIYNYLFIEFSLVADLDYSTIGYFRSINFYVIAIVVQLLSCVWLFVTAWTAACQASVSFNISWSLLKYISIESIMLSKHLILCCPLLLLLSVFHRIRVFSKESFFTSGGLSIGASASASVLPVNIQCLFPLEWCDPWRGSIWLHYLI